MNRIRLTRLLRISAGEQWTNSVPPELDRLVTNVDATLMQKILHIRSEIGKRPYSITAKGMISGLVLR